MNAAERQPSGNEKLTDEEIRARHRRDSAGMERTEEVLRRIREGQPIEPGIAGEDLRDFLRERL